jgi:hypothetical protein
MFPFGAGVVGRHHGADRNTLLNFNLVPAKLSQIRRETEGEGEERGRRERISAVGEGKGG